MTDSLWHVLAALLSSALFSGIEIAFISSDKLHIEVQGKQGGFTARLLNSFQQRPSRFIATLLVGNTISLVLYSFYMAKALDPWLMSAFPMVASSDALFLLVTTLISTLVVLITAEYLPKSLFMINPNRMIEIFSIPLAVIYWALSPLVFIITGLAKGVLNGVFKLEYNEEKPVFGLTDMNDYIRKVAESEDDHEAEVDHEIFSRAIEFKNLKVRDCMIPRTELAAVELDESIDDLVSEFGESGHSKILVYQESIDNVLGYCHTSSLFSKPDDIKSIMSPILMVPETMMARELMVKFISENKSIALVVDEFGGTAGIVTLEDVMEEIVGDIQDEHDQEEFIEQRIDENNFILSARLEIDYLNEKYEWHIPEGEYDTLGGFILDHNEDLPRLNQVIKMPPFTFTVLSLDRARIDKVRLNIK